MKTYVQQIMLGSVTSNEAQARETLQKIKAAGYDGLCSDHVTDHALIT